MKSIFLNLGTQVLRNVLAGQGAESILSSLLGSPAPAPAPRTAPHADFAYLTRYAKRLFVLTAVGFVCTMFFVMGSMMAISAVAQSIDLFGVFVASAFFYTGFAIAALAGLGALLCVSKARKHNFSWEFFFRHTESPVTISTPEIKNYASTTARAAPSSYATTSGAYAQSEASGAGYVSSDAHPAEETRRPSSERIAS
ncbi:MAG: hypothetical protein EOP11_00795 [Proteobacteria bacterium]|nr:MAG: hypothetical protein EOP11_00795 [Pseudomonadota bacterium]